MYNSSTFSYLSNTVVQNKYFIKWVLLSTVVLLLLSLDLSLGSVHIPIIEVLGALFGSETDHDTWRSIILLFRLPRVATALLAGSGLAVSGLLMQTFFRNPLAGPFVLGISSGASLGVALLVLSGSILSIPLLVTDTGMMIMAILGASFVLSIVIVTANHIRDSTSLLIIGLMFGSIAGAIVGILQFFSNAKQIQSFMIWTFGSLGGVSWYSMPVFAGVLIVTMITSYVFFKPLNVLLLGENYAQSMGVRLKRFRFIILILTSILAGSITAFCGPIAFVGIAVPHLTRSIFGTQNHKVLIPAVALVGAGLMLFCDMISQMPWSEFVLPINAVTSVIGAPVVIWVILRKPNLGKSFGG